VATRNKYDQAARFAGKLDPMGFLLWLLAGMDQFLRFSRWLDTRRLPIPGQADRVCDTVADLVDANGLTPPWAVIVEFEGEPDPEMPERLLEYAIQARRELRHGPYGRDKYLVSAVVVNLTGVGSDAALEMTFPGTTGLKLSWQPGVRNLVTFDATGALAKIQAGQIARCVLPWVPLMAGADGEGIITEWKRLAAQEPNDRQRLLYAGLALIFADKARRRAIWERALEGWNVKEASIIDEWQEEARAEAHRNDLLRLLRSKFGGALNPELIQAIQKQQTARELSHWFDIALAAGSLEQFEAILGIGKNGAAHP